jgi:hypothetical protein
MWRAGTLVLQNEWNDRDGTRTVARHRDEHDRKRGTGDHIESRLGFSSQAINGGAQRLVDPGQIRSPGAATAMRRRQYQHWSGMRSITKACAASWRTPRTPTLRRTACSGVADSRALDPATTPVIDGSSAQGPSTTRHGRLSSPFDRRPVSRHLATDGVRFELTTVPERLGAQALIFTRPRH